MESATALRQRILDLKRENKQLEAMLAKLKHIEEATGVKLRVVHPPSK